MKQKHLLRAVGDKDKFEYKAAGSIHDDIIHNIERKLSLLHQLWLRFTNIDLVIFICVMK